MPAPTAPRVRAKWEQRFAHKPAAIVPTPEQCDWLRRLSGPMEFYQTLVSDRFARHCYLRSGLEPSVELSAFSHRLGPGRACQGLRLRQVRGVPEETHFFASTRFVRTRVVLWQSNGFVIDPSARRDVAEVSPNPRLNFPVYTGQGDLTLSGIVFGIDDESEVLIMLDEQHAQVVSFVTERARIDAVIRARIAVLPEHLKRWIAALKAWERLPLNQLPQRAPRLS